MNFKREVLVGSLWSLLGNSGQQIIGFIIFIYIARTVTPADVGLIALALVLVSILMFVSRFGLVQALQRHVDLSDEMIDTAFWMLAVLGIVTTAAVFGSSYLAWTISDDPKLPSVLMYLSSLCALQAWNAVPEAVLRRRFDYRSLSLRNWIAALLGGAVGVYLAYHGYGVYALVAQRVATAIAQTVASWAFLRWHPRFRFNWDYAKHLFVVGGEIMLAGFAGVMNTKITDAVAGTMLGPTPLGFLRLGWRFFDVLVTVSVNPVTNVALTTFSRLNEDRPAMRRAYLRLTQFMACASLPTFFGLGAVADVMVPVVFGEKWMPSVIVLELLGYVILGSTINFFFSPVMIAVGRSRALLSQSVYQLIVTAGLVYIGTYFGIIGVMIAFIVRGFFVAAYNIHAMVKAIDLDVWAVVRVLIPPIVACAVMVGAVDLAKSELGHLMPDIVLLMVLIVIGGGVYGLTLLIGDYAGLWRGYVRDAVALLLGTLANRGHKPAASTA